MPGEKYKEGIEWPGVPLEPANRGRNSFLGRFGFGEASDGIVTEFFLEELADSKCITVGILEVVCLFLAVRIIITADEVLIVRDADDESTAPAFGPLLSLLGRQLDLKLLGTGRGARLGPDWSQDDAKKKRISCQHFRATPPK